MQPSESSPNSTTAQSLSLLNTISHDIRRILETSALSEQVRTALTKILAFTGKAAEDEANRQLPGEGSAALMEKLSKSAEQLGNAAERLETATAEIHTKLTTVTSTSSQLESTANTYKDALLKIPTQLSHPREASGMTDPAIGRSADRKTGQVLIDFQDDQITSLSVTAIKEKVSNAIKETTSPPPPKDIAIEEIIKLHNNGIIILFGSKEAAEWLQNSSQAELTFTSYLAPDSHIRLRQHNILVPKTPITLDPSNEAHLREIEEVNGLKEGSISKIRWVKPERRRNPSQHLAHAIFSLSSAEAANVCIRDGLFIHGIKSYPSKLKHEPMQCLKCKKWGHFANQCTASRDTCGTCGGDHWTNACTEPTKRYCVSCSAHSHASWDRRCPEFLRRCTQFDETHPENVLKYYPTDETWTKVIRPPKIPFADRFPAHFAVGSLPPPNHERQRESPTRPIRQRCKCRTPTRATGQTAITNYYPSNRSQARIDNVDAETREEGDTADFLSAHSDALTYEGDTHDNLS
jgi:hypothetical protein